MGDVRGNVRSETEANFRRLAMKRYGYGRGSLAKALEEALNAWNLENSKLLNKK